MLLHVHALARALARLRTKMAVCFQLTLARHGETEANRLRIIQGHQDVALSERGRQQARLLGTRLAKEKLTAIYCSDLLRASETAEIIATQLGGRSVGIVKDSRMRERGYGEAEGQPVSMLVQAARRHRVPVAEYTPLGGETRQQFRDRVEDVFTTLCSEHAHQDVSDINPCEGAILWRYLQSIKTPPPPPPTSHVLVVSHGGLIHEVMNHMHESFVCELPARAATTPNTAVSSFLIAMETEPELRCVSVTTLCIHDASHLQ